MEHRQRRLRPTLGLMLIGLLSFGSSANAGLIGVKTIDITSNVSDWFSIVEVEAFQTGTGINFASSANGGVASATTSGWGTVPGGANDGNTNGNYIAGSLWISGTKTGNDVLTITLPTPTELDSIRVWGRTDCCSLRVRDLLVSLYGSSDELLFSKSGFDVSGGSQSIDLTLLELSATVTVPEPNTVALLAIGLVGIGLRRKFAVRGLN